VNHGMKPVRFNLEIAIRSDFADLFEVKSGHIIRRGRIFTEWCADKSRLRNAYRNRDFHRDFILTLRCNGSGCAYANGRLSFEIELAAGAEWHACLLYEPGDGNIRLEAPPECIADREKTEAGRRLAWWQSTVLKVEARNDEFVRFVRQAIDDTAALRLPAADTEQPAFVPAAGIPWFATLFGRDSLIASIQNAIAYPPFACGTLDALGRLQATARDDYRDAEPGKIMHELRHGELAHFKLIPHTPYYGTADATMLYLIVLHVAWRCTGEQALLERHLKTAEACLAWIDEFGDRDGDGFQEYATRSPAGYENQGWKDAGDAVLHPDGSPVRGPKALCELQGYVYDAWQRMAEIFDELGKTERAKELREKASALFQRFDSAFWDEDSGFYAYALDGEKRKVLTVASNPGHCLWSGIVPEKRARRVVDRLMQSDMWTGWGIRTLSANHPAYNPHSYQNGSTWPHDNGVIAMGFRRYGFAEEAAQVVRGVTQAGSYFALHQLPELYAGFQRDPDAFPVQYLGANVPQAWAAGTAFALLQTIVGYQPDAPRDRLYIDPILPTWLPELTLNDLQIGRHKLDLSIWRDAEITRWEVRKGRQNLIAQRSYAGGSRLCGAVPCGALDRPENSASIKVRAAERQTERFRRP
jgi:glycogen debranching enzyme